jgi:hypothetical protein
MNVTEIRNKPTKNQIQGRDFLSSSKGNYYTHSGISMKTTLMPYPVCLPAANSMGQHGQQ